MTGYIFIHHLKSQKQHAKEFEAIALPAWLRTRNVKTDFSMYVCMYQQSRAERRLNDYVQLTTHALEIKEYTLEHSTT
jgi:hypothetical protein